MKQLMIMLFMAGNQVQLARESGLLPSLSSVIVLADPADKDNFMMYSSVIEEPADIDTNFLDPMQVVH